MRGTPSRRTTSACLPIRRRIWAQARAEPTASPSGRACDVSRKRLRCSMCLITSSSIFVLTFFPLLGTVQKLVDSGAELVGAIELKMKLRRPAQMQILRYFPANESNRRGQSLQRAYGFCLVSLQRDKNSRRAGVLGKNHTGNADQADAGVAEFAFNDGLDLLAQGFSEPFTMVLAGALLHSFPPE